MWHTIFLCCRQKLCKKPWWSPSSSLKTFRGTNMKWVWILACHGDGHTPAEMVMLTNGLCMTSEFCGQNVQLHVIGYHLENYEWCEVVWLALQVCQLVVAFNTAFGFWHWKVHWNRYPLLVLHLFSHCSDWIFYWPFKLYTVIWKIYENKDGRCAFSLDFFSKMIVSYSF